MDIVKSIFQRRTVNIQKLIDFGFIKNDDIYMYQTTFSESGFIMTINISEQGDIEAKIIDPSFNEPYTLHLADGAVGSFVGGIKTEYEQTLTEISEKCFEPDVFKTAQAKKLIEYVRTKYDDELEFLWKKFPDNAIWRRKDNKKWYGTLLTVSKRKLGIKSDEIIEIIDLRIQPDKIESLIDNKLYFPGWHMNKKNWYTMILDGSIEFEELCQRIDESYVLATK